MIETISQMDLAPPGDKVVDGMVMHILLAIGITAIVVLLVLRRCHLWECPECGRRHPIRPSNMNAEEYSRIYCKDEPSYAFFDRRSWWWK